MFRQIAELSTGPRDGSPGGLLTEREREIVGLIDAGLSNKKIALSLGIEVATVKNHVHHILEKLQVTRRGEAAARVPTGDWWPVRLAQRQSDTSTSAKEASGSRRLGQH
jgi:DNA-binding NarL/FixJ family response regulator